MDGTLDSFQILFPNGQKSPKRETPDAFTQVGRKKLSLNKHFSSSILVKSVCNSPYDIFNSRKPFQTLKNENNSLSKFLNREVKFLRPSLELNEYNKTLLKSVENKNTMSSKKKLKGIKKKNNNEVNSSQRTILSYFKSECSTSKWDKEQTSTLSISKSKTVKFDSKDSNRNGIVNNDSKDLNKNGTVNNDSKDLNKNETVNNDSKNSNKNGIVSNDSQDSYKNGIVNNDSKDLNKNEIATNETLGNSSKVIFIDLCDSSSSSISPELDIVSTEKTIQIQSQVVNSSLRCTSTSSIQNVSSSKLPTCDRFNIFKESTEVSSTTSVSLSTPRIAVKRLSSMFSGGGRKKLKECPSYKVVEGTPFAVDAFNYGDIPGVEVYFLTHFHSDHYIGLNKSFNKPLYCTKITGDLCEMKLRINKNCIKILETDTTINVCGIEVTTVDANHCPGSVMFIFSLPTGKSILHCGDFRACSFMESYPVFWNKEIHTVYLDTTYCNPRYDFPTQSESISRAVSILKEKKKMMETNKRNFRKVLIVCGTYSVGKERFFMGVAKGLKMDVWAPSDKSTILKIVLGEDFHSKPPRDCQLHVLPMGKINYNALEMYLKGINDRFEEIVAFKPSGWELSRSSLIQRGNITIHGIPYSEHSSFSELQRFIKFIRPKHVIPTVPGNGGNKAMQKYFYCWVGEKGQKSQTRVSDFFQVNSQK